MKPAKKEPTWKMLAVSWSPCIQLGSFEAGSQLRTLQYQSTKATHLHLKGFDNKERGLFVLLCHDIDDEDLFSFFFFARRHTQELFASKQPDVTSNETLVFKISGCSCVKVERLFFPNLPDKRVSSQRAILIIVHVSQSINYLIMPVRSDNETTH